MKGLDSFISVWKNLYSQQGQTGRILFSCFSLLVLCALCSIPVGLLRSRNASNVVPGSNVLLDGEITATPTPLYNFGLETFTPFPTFPSSTALPTVTAAPTTTATSTAILPTETVTPLPTATSLPATNAGSIAILSVDKSTEYVDIKNISSESVNLNGWRLVSEKGKQSCTLSGVLQPNTILRVWSGTNDTGFSCRFPINIWNNDTPDAAVLYKPQGEEVSRYP